VWGVLATGHVLLDLGWRAEDAGMRVLIYVTALLVEGPVRQERLVHFDAPCILRGPLSTPCR